MDMEPAVAGPSTATTPEVYQVPKILICGICLKRLDEPHPSYPDENAICITVCAHAFHKTCHLDYFFKHYKQAGRDPDPKVACAVCKEEHSLRTHKVCFLSRNDDDEEDSVPTKKELISLREQSANLTAERDALLMKLEDRSQLCDTMDKEIEEDEAQKQIAIKERDKTRQQLIDLERLGPRRRCFLL